MYEYVHIFSLHKYITFKFENHRKYTNINYLNHVYKNKILDKKI
jgi:hypothetical protein